MAPLQHISWYVQTFLKKYGKVLFGSTVIAILAFVFLPNVVTLLSFGKTTTYIGRVGRSPLSQLPRDIQNMVSFGLMQSGEDGEVSTALASSYRIEENGKAYRFTIRPDTYWQDRQVATPQDVTYSFSDMEIARSQNDILFRLTARKQDETAPDPVLPVSFLTTVSQPLFRQIETRNLFFQKTYKIIGLGEYQITSVKYNGPLVTEVTLESTKQKIVYRFYATESDAIQAFKHGDVDRLENILDVSLLRDWGTAEIASTKRTNQYLGVFFNLSYLDGDNLVFSNKNLRVALNYAIPKKQGEDRVLSPINKKSWAYPTNGEDIDVYEQDMSQAAQLLAKADTPTKLNIDLTTTPTYLDTADQIASSWETLGEQAVALCSKDSSIPTDQCNNKKIDVNVKISNFPDTSSYEVMLAGQQIPNDPDQYALWHSTQSTNFTHYKNARIDKLLEDGRRTIDREERKLIYREFQTLLVKESPAIFLEPITSYTVTRRHILPI